MVLKNKVLRFYETERSIDQVFDAAILDLVKGVAQLPNLRWRPKTRMCPRAQDTIALSSTLIVLWLITILHKLDG